MLAWTIEVAAYTTLALIATWASWRTPMAFVGLVLVGATVLSDIAYFGASLGTHLVVEVMTEVAIVRAAALSMAGGEVAVSRMIIALAGVDAIFTAALSYSAWAYPAFRVGYIFGAGNNAMFALQCFCTMIPGVRNAYLDRHGYRSSSHGVDIARLNRQWLEDHIDKIERQP